jgi:hypothetical protein
MIFEQVQIIQSNSTKNGRGVYSGKQTDMGYAFMNIAAASSQLGFTSGVRGISVSHEGYARRTPRWQNVKTNDVIVYRDTVKLKVMQIIDDGEPNSKYLRFLLDENSVQEVRQ